MLLRYVTALMDITLRLTRRDYLGRIMITKVQVWDLVSDEFTKVERTARSI